MSPQNCQSSYYLFRPEDVRKKISTQCQTTKNVFYSISDRPIEKISAKVVIFRQLRGKKWAKNNCHLESLTT
jgi:hypothetical protein